MKRILVLGSGGAGKSTLTRELQKKLQIPVIHLDAHYFSPNWVEPERTDWEETVKKLSAGEEWIMDGNYSSTLAIRLERANTVVFLDFPNWKCTARILWRGFKYRGQIRPSMAAGCKERVNWQFLKYVWGYPNRSRPRVLRLLEEEKDRIVVYRLKNEKEVKDFLRNY
ncbi:MAG: hypothetical protein AB8B69_14075 [Chitinophagales bacterium]